MGKNYLQFAYNVYFYTNPFDKIDDAKTLLKHKNFSRHSTKNEVFVKWEALRLSFQISIFN